MYRLRRKRAAPQDLYPACKISNTCPPDVQNKYEHTTIADKILQWGSLGVFFGGLGIGTGRGGGGSSGYVPLGGETGGVSVGARAPVRPSAPVIEAVGPKDIFPVDAVDPLGPSVIAPAEIPPTVDLANPNIEVIAEIHPLPEIPAGTLPPIEEGVPAVIEVTSHDPEAPPFQVQSRSQYNNPTFEVALVPNTPAGETSASDHVFVGSATEGSSIGQQIPLESYLIPGVDEGIEETSFIETSTPISRPAARPRALYGRRIEQRRVASNLFQNRARNLVVFDNPAFDDMVDLMFTEDLSGFDQPTAAPDPQFQDVVWLSRPIFSEAPTRNLRVSRLGQTAGIKTRSGAYVGSTVHFFQDLSSIAPEDSIELVTFAEHSGDSVTVVSDSTSFEVVTLDTPSTYSDSDLLDVYEDVGNSLQLVFGTGRRAVGPIDIPFTNVIKPPIVFPDISEGVTVFTPQNFDKTSIPAEVIDIPDIIISWDNSTGDFSLHPSYFRKRRRKHKL